MPSALVNGVRLNHVQMAAPDAGPQEDLVMVHGLATNMAFWYFHYAAVFARHYRVTLYDLRGHGRSEMTADGYTPDNLARDLEGLLDHLSIRRAHFLVHSFGGVIALNLARIAPERIASLVLADTHISAARGAAGQVWEYGTGMQTVLDDAGVALDTRDPYFGYRLLTEVARMQLDREPVPTGLEKLVGPLIANGGSRTAAQWLRLMRSTSAEKELMGEDGLSLEALRRLRFPILAMYGDNSQARLTGEELLGCGRMPNSGGCAMPATSSPRVGRPRSSRPAASSGTVTSKSSRRIVSASRSSATSAATASSRPKAAGTA